MNVVVHSESEFEESVENPLGEEGVTHRMWTWPDGSWLLIRFYDDGCARATTSRSITVSLSEVDGELHVAVQKVHRALKHTPTAENNA